MWGINNYGTSVYTEIERYKKLISKEKEVIEDHQTIVDSLTDSLIREVRNVFIPYSDKMMHEASCQQNNTNKSEKKMFLFMEEDLIERIFDETEREYVSLEKIMRCGYEDYAYCFEFKYNNGKVINFELKIPNVKKARKENIGYMEYGKYRFLYEKKEGYWNTIKESYDLDEIADAIRDFLKGA